VFGSEALEGLSDEVFQEGGEADRGVLGGSSSGSADPATNSQAPAVEPRRGQTGTRLIGPCTGPLTRPPILPSLSLGLSAQPRRPLRSTRSSSSRPRPRAAGRLGGPSPEQRPSALCLVLFLLRNQGRARCSIASVFRVMVGLWFVRRGLRLHLFREMVGPRFALRGRRLQVTHGGMLLQSRSLVAWEPGKPALLRALDRQ
jgi:hypothetical protein